MTWPTKPNPKNEYFNDQTSEEWFWKVRTFQHPIISFDIYKSRYTVMKTISITYCISTLQPPVYILILYTLLAWGGRDDLSQSCNDTKKKNDDENIVLCPMSEERKICLSYIECFLFQEFEYFLICADIFVLILKRKIGVDVFAKNIQNFF